MKIKAVFTNEMPFMIQLPSDEYEIKVRYGKTKNEYTIKLNLSDEIYRLHLDREPGIGRYEEGKVEELQEYIVSNNVTHYTYAPLKSYITCCLEEELIITQDMINDVTEEIIIEKLMIPFFREAADKGNLISGKQAKKKAESYFKTLKTEEKQSLIREIIIRKNLNRLKGFVYIYHKAINVFLKQYSHIRGDFFVEPLTMHTLEGTYVSTYINDILYERIKHAGKVPTIMTHKQWMPDIESTDLKELKKRLVTFYEVSPTKELILTARNLLERGEYRSAVINASAALEVAVENKIIEKMKASGETDQKILTYLRKTKMDFPRRCDSQLQQQTGNSLVKNEPTIWSNISGHRSKFRHKIAHSSLVPEEVEAEAAVNDFEKALNWVEAL